MSHWGVDVSSNNQHPINWAALYTYLRAQGNDVPFAVIKVNQGTGYVNPDAQADFAAAKSAGFAVAGYMMDQGNAAVTSEIATFKAQTVYPELDDDELPEGLSSGAYTAHLAPLAATGHVQYLNQSEEDAGFPEGGGIWEANYNGEPGTVHHANVLIHQYTAAGSVPGCLGQFDLNYWTGTEAQFAQLFAGQVAAASVVPEVVSSMASVIGVAPNLKGKGYWIAFTDGSVWSFGGAPFYGSYPGLPAAEREAAANFVGFSSVLAGGYVLVNSGVTAKGAGCYTFGPQ